MRFMLLLVGTGAIAPVYATNGMGLEGYGPVSTGMGGISQAIEHGTAGMMANPATLALIPAESLLEIALGALGPRIQVSSGGMTTRSLGSSYVVGAGWICQARACLDLWRGCFCTGWHGYRIPS